MNNENYIVRMLQLLRENNVYSTNDFAKDLVKLVNNDVNIFIENFYKDMLRKNLENYNRHKMLSLNKKQREKLDGNNLYRYEYRKCSNLRCIYLVENGNNTNKVILLCAFNEDGNKKKGKNSYNNNIDRAIRIYLNIKN